MIRYYNAEYDYIYEIEIPSDAIHNENTLECADKENASYEANKYIIRNIINVPTKKKLKKLYLVECDYTYNYNVTYYKTYDRALQEISFTDLRKMNAVSRDDFPSIFRTYYYNGSLYTEFYHNKGSLEGPYKFYELDGTCSVECTFVNGKIHGECIVYDEDNKFYRTYKFIDGKIQHIDSYYDYNDLDKYLIPHDLQSKIIN